MLHGPCTGCGWVRATHFDNVTEFPGHAPSGGWSLRRGMITLSQPPGHAAAVPALLWGHASASRKG